MYENYRMKPLVIFIYIGLIFLGARGLASAQQWHPDDIANPPKNVVFILADDLGWNDTSIYQFNRFYETPNIDALAQKGMIFTHAYSNSPLCSPTRASILTGQTPARHGIINPNISIDEVRLKAQSRTAGPSNQPSTAPLTATRLDTALPTLAKMLKANGYNTAHFGKWHLGSSPFSALEHGFDIDLPNYSGSGPAGGYFSPWSFAPNLIPNEDKEHIDIHLAKEASQWILEHHSDGPFYLNFWPFSVHAPFGASRSYIDYFIDKRSAFNSQRNATYAGMIKHFDDAIGILWRTLEEAGLENNTVIVFTSDNGGNMYNVLGQTYPTSNFPLRGGKATQFDGGTRVPTFMIWPGLTPPNTINNTPIQTVDYYPTILGGLGISWPQEHHVDGVDIRPLLAGNQIDSRPVITYYPTRPLVPDWLPPSATISQDGWKLIKTFHYGVDSPHLNALYNLNEDVGESKNLAETHPDVLAKLDTTLMSYLDRSETPLPTANPDYVLGSFNYDHIGKPAQQFRLPEALIPSEAVIELDISATKASAGERVYITWELRNSTPSANVSYRQFMGPDVSLIENPGQVSFFAPTVSTNQFIGFAFIVQDGQKILRKQIAIEIDAVNVAPNIVIQSESLEVQSGESIVIQYLAEDDNKDILSVDLISESLNINAKLNPALRSYTLSVPQSFSESSADLELVASDGQIETSAGTTLKITTSTPNMQPTDKSPTKKILVVAFIG